MAENNQTLQISSIPVADDNDENSFVILNSCITGDFEERLDSLPPIESMTLKDIQHLMNGELSRISAQAQRPKSDPAISTPSPSLRTYSNEDIQKKVEELISENEKLKSALQQNNLSMKAQKEKIILWQKEIEKFCQAHKDKLTEAKETIDKLKDTNLKLSDEVAKYKEIKILQDEEIVALKQQLKEKPTNDQLVASSKDSFEKLELDMMNQKIQDQEILVKQLQQKNNELIETNQQLNEKATKYDSLEEFRQLEQKKFNELREELIEKRQLLELKEQKWQDEINELKLENRRLCEQQNNGDTLRKEIDELKLKYDPNLIEKHEQLRLQLMNAQKKITDLDEELLKSTKQIDELTKQLDGRKSNDEIFVLQQQLEIYKSDYDAEVQAKSLLKDENRQMTEDLKSLQKRNQQLLEQVERLRLQSGLATTTTTTQRASAPTATVPPGGYTCPKCSFNFTNYQSLENHIHRCLEIYE